MKKILIAAYKFLALFFYRRWCKTEGIKIPTGVPGNRDPEAVCEYYRPFGVAHMLESCCGDGHYLCEKCVFKIKHEDDKEYI